MSSTLSLTLILQLALPLQATAGGNTTQADVMGLGSKNISQGNVPANTKEYLNSLCKRIKEASTGSVGPDAELKLTQKYDLATTCKSPSAKLPDAVKTYCTLYETAKESQVNAYCDARQAAIDAKQGTEVAYKLDLAAAATCWAEYIATKAQESNGILGGVAKAASIAKGKVCGTASMAASVAEVWTTVKMIKHQKGDKVSADGQVKSASDFEKIGGTVLQMGLSGVGALSGIQYGACLLFNKCNKYSEKGSNSRADSKSNSNSDSSLTNAEKAQLSKSNVMGPDNATTKQVHELASSNSNTDKIQKIMGGGNPHGTVTGTSNITKVTNTVTNTNVVNPVNPAPKLDWSKINGAGTNKFNGGAAKLYGGNKLNGETSNMTFSPGGPIIGSVMSSIIKSMMTGTTGGTAGGGGGPIPQGGTGNGGGTPNLDKVNNFNFNPNRDTTGSTTVANTTKPSGGGGGGGSRASKGSGDDYMAEKTQVMMKSAMTFTVLAGLRYLARNSAKKTQENAEGFLNSMISTEPTLANVPTLKAGGGYKAGSGYVGSTSGLGGDQSGLTGTPEEMLAPRGSPQRGAFDQVAAQIPESLMDSAGGPGGVGGAIGQIAGAMGGDGKAVAAYAGDGAARAIAAMGMSDDIYATTSGGSSGSNKKSDGGLNLNLGALNGENQQAQEHQTEEMNFRAPASSCNGDIYHANCKTDMNMFQIVSERYSLQPIAKEGMQAF